MTVTCKLCGTPISSLDINKKKRRIEIQRKIANHVKAVHKDTVDIVVHNALVLTDLISQYIHLDLTNIPALDTDAQEYKDELTDNILGIMEIELDSEDDDDENGEIDNAVDGVEGESSSNENSTEGESNISPSPPTENVSTTNDSPSNVLSE